MAIIYTYPEVQNPDGTELVVVTETKNKNATRIMTIAGICEFCSSEGCENTFKFIQTSSATAAEAVGCKDTLILTSSDASVTITNAGNTIDFKSAGGGSGGCPTTYVLKPVSCNTETGETICTLDEDARNWIFTCESSLESLTPGYIKLSNNGSPVTYPIDEEELRDCWYADVWSPVPTGLESCEECCAPPEDPVIRGTNCETDEVLFETLQSNISGPGGWESAIDNDCEFGQFTGGEAIDCIKLTTAGVNDGTTPILDSIKSLSLPDCGCDCCLYECSFILEPCPGDPPAAHDPLAGAIVAPDDIGVCESLTTGQVVNITYSGESYCYSLSKVCLTPEIPVSMVPVDSCDNEVCGEPAEFLRFKTCEAEEWLWEDESDPIPAAFRSPGIHYIGDLDGGDTHSFCVDGNCCIEVQGVAFSGPTAPWAVTAPCDFAYETSSSSCSCCIYYDVVTYQNCDEECFVEGFPQINIDVCAWGQTIGESWKPSSAPDYIKIDLGGGGDVQCCYQKVDPNPCVQENLISGAAKAYSDLSTDESWASCEDCSTGEPIIRLQNCATEEIETVLESDLSPSTSTLIVGDVIEVTGGALPTKCWQVVSREDGTPSVTGSTTWTGPASGTDVLTACQCCEQELRRYDVCEGAIGETCAATALSSLIIDVSLVPGWSPATHTDVVAQEIGGAGESCCYTLSEIIPPCQVPNGQIVITTSGCEDILCTLV